MYQRNFSKSGNQVLEADVEVVIATAEGTGSKSLAIGQYGCTIKSVNVSGSLTTDTTVKFYSGANLMKSIQSTADALGTGVSGIDNTDEIRMEKNGINKITIVSTADKASGVKWSLGIEAK